MSKIPVIENPSNIKLDDLIGLITKGFCYAKIPDYQELKHDFVNIQEKALEFYRQDASEKNKIKSNPREFIGYSNRENQIIEQFYCRPQNLIGPYVKCKHSVARMTDVFLNKIELPILQQIFKHFAIEEFSYQRILQNPCLTIAMSYYAENPLCEYQHGMTTHKDYGYITALYVDKPGLQLWLNGEWTDVMPETGYAVVNLGNALELALGKQTASGLHRVIPPEGERLTIGLFHDGNLQEAFYDLTTNKAIYEKYSTYLARQFSIQYEDPKEHEVMIAQAKQHLDEF